MKTPEAMLAMLEAWTLRGWLRELDLAFARFLLAEVPAAPAPLALAAALVSHQLGRGHVCLDLEATLEDPRGTLSLPPDREGEENEDASLPTPGELLAGWSPADWVRCLDEPDLVGAGDGRTPLVLAGHRLYLRRYWRHERQVEAAIIGRVGRTGLISATLPEAPVKAALAALFPQSDGGTDWQKIACALAVRGAFTIVTGGPGTGKTTTVVRLLALLQFVALGQQGGRPLRIRLAAPTGKAAARLKESIAGAIDRLPALPGAGEAVKAAIPTDVATIHRLLGTLPDTRAFRHDARNPLPLDVLVVDEGSMVDLEMMAAMLAALPADARLVLLGDKDQLASVEAGSVLGELCRRAAGGHFLPATVHWVEAMTGESIGGNLVDPRGLALDQRVVMLRESRRFGPESGIGRLAAAVNSGEAAGIRRAWEGRHADLARHDLPNLDDPRLEALLAGAAEGGDGPQGFAHYLAAARNGRPPLDAGREAFDAWASGVLEARGRFQLLCALRHGPHGVTGMNRRIEALLNRRGLIDPASGAWYAGRPVLVTRNDYSLGLMNGDIGIALPLPVPDKAAGEPVWALRVAFARDDGKGGVRWVLPSRLLAVETVFALTVHKSQGSEFDHCALLLPPAPSPVLTRELLYTGITRARRWFSLISAGNPGLLEEAAARTVRRSGGLFRADGNT